MKEVFCCVTECKKVTHRKGHCFSHYAILKEHSQKTAEYRIWAAIKRRCYNKNSHGYHFYGARGVTMSNEWKESFVNFFLDMGYRPVSDLSIDRINHTRGYEAQNCRWADKKTQARNRKLPITNTSGYRGVSPYKGKWHASIGIDAKTISLGYYADKKEAALAYNKAAVVYHGKDAVLNVID